MSTQQKLPKCFPRSDWEDGVYYPSSDGKPMAETGIHVNALIALFQVLLEYFKNRDDVLITANQYWYWEKGNPKARRAPDVMVVIGVPKEPPRRSYRMWLEGNTLPAAIFEMSSKKTIENDLGIKFKQYEQIGVHEYFLFDPDARVLRPALQGFRLDNGRYVRIEPVGDELESDLGVRIRIEGKLLRLADSRTGQPLLSRAERFDEELELNKRLAAEVERLKAEITRLKGGQP